MTDTPTYDWKYLVCPLSLGSWDEFAEHGTWQTHPYSNRDFDCTRVAEDIAAHLGPREDVTICLMDPHGNRHEVDIRRKQVVEYETLRYRDIPKLAQLTQKYALPEKGQLCGPEEVGHGIDNDPLAHEWSGRTRKTKR
jgi:hypothetical protein